MCTIHSRVSKNRRMRREINIHLFFLTALVIVTIIDASPVLNEWRIKRQDLDRKWTMSEWSNCTSVCEGGLRVRSVRCLDEDGVIARDCDTNKKPTEYELCNQVDCTDTSVTLLDELPDTGQYNLTTPDGASHVVTFTDTGEGGFQLEKRTTENDGIRSTTQITKSSFAQAINSRIESRQSSIVFRIIGGVPYLVVDGQNIISLQEPEIISVGGGESISYKGNTITQSNGNVFNSVMSLYYFDGFRFYRFSGDKTNPLSGPGQLYLNMGIGLYSVVPDFNSRLSSEIATALPRPETTDPNSAVPILISPTPSPTVEDLDILPAPSQTMDSLPLPSIAPLAPTPLVPQPEKPEPDENDGSRSRCPPGSRPGKQKNEESSRRSKSGKKKDDECNGRERLPEEDNPDDEQTASDSSHSHTHPHTQRRPCREMEADDNSVSGTDHETSVCPEDPSEERAPSGGRAEDPSEDSTPGRDRTSGRNRHHHHTSKDRTGPPSSSPRRRRSEHRQELSMPPPVADVGEVFFTVQFQTLSSGEKVLKINGEALMTLTGSNVQDVSDTQMVHYVNDRLIVRNMAGGTENEREDSFGMIDRLIVLNTVKEGLVQYNKGSDQELPGGGRLYTNPPNAFYSRVRDINSAIASQLAITAPISEISLSFTFSFEEIGGQKVVHLLANDSSILTFSSNLQRISTHSGQTITYSNGALSIGDRTGVIQTIKDVETFVMFDGQSLEQYEAMESTEKSVHVPGGGQLFITEDTVFHSTDSELNDRIGSILLSIAPGPSLPAEAATPLSMPTTAAPSSDPQPSNELPSSPSPSTTSPRPVKPNPDDESTPETSLDPDEKTHTKPKPSSPLARPKFKGRKADSSEENGHTQHSRHTKHSSSPSSKRPKVKSRSLTSSMRSPRHGNKKHG